jgi:hypothetical protein
MKQARSPTAMKRGQRIDATTAYPKVVAMPGIPAVRCVTAITVHRGMQFPAQTGCNLFSLVRAQMSVRCDECVSSTPHFDFGVAVRSNALL